MNQPRPTIDFSDVDIDRSKARRYAEALDSRVLKAENRETLQAIARGERVDAYAANRAVTEALSSCATRAGQSMARRRMTEMGRHLGYIVQGVLENHADGLPGMEPGVRSHKIKVLEERLAAAESEKTLAQERLAEQANERYTLTQAASDERRRLCADIDGLRVTLDRALSVGAVRDQIVADLVVEKTDLELSVQRHEQNYAGLADDYRALKADLEPSLEDAQQSREVIAAALVYAVSALDEEAKQRVFGYLDGVADGMGVDLEGVIDL
jgi:hypothetical protein